MRNLFANSKKLLKSLVVGLFASTITVAAFAGTENLSQTPLFLSTSADPNIMLLFDDSTSMDFQLAASVGTVNGVSTYPEVDSGEPVGLRCNFSLPAILADALSLNVTGLTSDVQNLVQCLVGTRVENPNGILQLPESLTGGICDATQNQLNADINSGNTVGQLLDQTLLTTCIVTALVSNQLSLNLLNPPQYHYAYLNDTDDNYFASSASDYTNGWLPVMLEEAMINPANAVSVAEGNGTTNPNFRPPMLTTYVCTPGLLGNSNCNSGVLPTFKYTDTTYAPTGTSGTADTRNACQYPSYSFKGAATTATTQGTVISTGYWRSWNSTYNPVAYNPEYTYKPWEGIDPSTGSKWANATPTAVRYDPLNTTQTYNLTTTQRHRGAISYRCGDNIIANILSGGTVLNSVTNSVNIKQLTANPASVTSVTYTGSFPPATTAQAGNLDGSTVGSYNAYVKAHNAAGLTWLQIYPARYYTWKDNNSNGVVDSWESHRLIEIRTTGNSGTLAADGITLTGATTCAATGAFGSFCPANFTHTSARTDCTGNVCTAAQELQNYANWFQYYRRRELTAKAAYSKVISDKTSVRMGMAVVVKNGSTAAGNPPGTAVPGPVGTSTGTMPSEGDPSALVTGTYKVARRVEPMNLDYTSPACTAAQVTAGTCDTTNAKRDLLDHLQRVNSGGGSTTFFGLSKPLRTGLYNVGQYFSEAGTNVFNFDHSSDSPATLNSHCPMLGLNYGGSCQQNFAVAITDGFWDSNEVFTSVGNVDGTNGAGPGNVNANCLACADNQTNTLADVAMKYYANDLSATLPNNEPTLTGVDEVKWQHMVTYSVAFGLQGALTANPTTRAAAFTWPNPFGSDEAKIDDLRHAAYDGRGAFLTASDSAGLETALNRIFTDISSRASSASSVALNSGSLNTGSQLFQARFNTSTWAGQLLAFPISSGPGYSSLPCTNELLGQVCPQIWDANTAVTGQDWDSGRVILTVRSDTRAGVAFRWSNLSSAQQGWLNKNITSSGSVTDALGSSRLNYVRGDRSNESASNFRVRSSGVLGDMINSDPFYVGAPHDPYDNMPGYSAFRLAKRSRTPMVYVGANDGMLHGFRASDGRELIAYVPGDSHIYKNLPQLTRQDYTSNHTYFVDGSPGIDDVQVSVGGVSTWKTVLVSGMRAGGQNVVALDVTDPSTFSEASASSLVLWQFSDADDPDLGYTFSRPSLVKLPNGKWATLIGNGYNSNETTTQNAADNGAGTGEACLFILYMNGPTGANKTWVLNTDYKKICVASGGPDNTVRPNGLASPNWVDSNGDGVVDFAYAGDLEGNMWKFDLSSSTDTNWGVAYSGSPLFTACSAATCTLTNRQPITTRPSIGVHPTGAATTNGVMVYFGTGKYFEVGDDVPTGQQTQSFYAVYDQLWGAKSPASNAIATATPTTTPTLPIPKSRLVQQQILLEESNAGANCTTDSNCYRVVTTNAVTLTPVSGTPTNQGWYLDLVNTQNSNTNNYGERVVSDSIIRGDRIVFPTLIPAADICAFGGSGWLMELSATSGGSLTVAPYDTNGDNVVNKSDNIPPASGSASVAPGGMKSPIGIIARPTILTVPSAGERKYLSGSDGSVTSVTESCPSGVCPRVLTWRQIR